MNLSSIIIPSQLRLALKLAPFAVIALLAAWLAIEKANHRADRQALTAATARFDQFAAEVRAKTAAAQADDLAHARRVETDQSTVTEGVSRDLETQLGDARRVAADYALRLREQAAQTHPAGGGATGVPEPAGRAGGAAGAGGAALLDDDVRICAENTVKAQGWQDWWAQQVAVPR